MKITTCKCCRTPMIQGLTGWHYICPGCNYEAADISPAINSASHPVKPDEKERETGLKRIRQQNFTVIISLMKRFTQDAGESLLDVGCAHGLFLDAAREHYDVEGIEPHHEVASYTQAKGYRVREGFFPDVLNQNDSYSAIVFNDVLEHIPDVDSCLEACQKILAPGGILVLNLPNSQGILYRLSRVLARFGATGIFERMWQLLYPSPHVHYFNFENLRRKVESHGFIRVHASRLETLTRDGLYHRIAHTGEYSGFTARILYGLAWLGVPMLKLLPGDIQLQIFQTKKLP